VLPPVWLGADINLGLRASALWSQAFRMSGARILIFANGVLPDLERARSLLPGADMLICADGGLRHARALGQTPAVVVGDLDSIDREQLAALAAANVELVQHPVDKDQTDLELALNYAVQHDPSSITIVGALGGRLDHALGNISLMLHPVLVGRDCRLDDGVEEAFFVADHAGVVGDPGDHVSLLPWGVPANGVHTEGLRWPLRGETLHAHRSRGVSNEMLTYQASIRLDSGLLLVVHSRKFGATSAR
jgi:thiamine pyrophosphokinase